LDQPVVSRLIHVKFTHAAIALSVGGGNHRGDLSMAASMNAQSWQPSGIVEAGPEPPSAIVMAPGRAATSPAGVVGNTPLLWIDDLAGREGRGFWAKLEGQNPGGIKDRAALYMVAQARARGQLRPGAPIIESTSGTLGLGLALAGVTFGHPVILVTDLGLEPAMAHLLRAYRSRVEVVDAPHPNGGWQQARLRRVHELLDAHPGAWWPDQYNNPDNVAGYAGLAAELVVQLGHVDVLVCSVGTGGHSAGIVRTLRRWCPGVRLVGVDSAGSTIFGQPARPRLMRGLGSSIHPRNVAYNDFDEVHWVAPGEAVWACRRLAASRYASGGWSTGAVALVASWLARTLPPGQRIVGVFPDGPARYATTIYNDLYCRQHELLDMPPAAEPLTLAHPWEQEVTRWSRCACVLDPLEHRVDGGLAPAPPASPAQASTETAGEGGMVR
jgi:S-sulfo-L-cysteine synthase (3-phospho-L-serine-dependent)